MEVQKAQSELESIQMIGGDLDNYMAKFERLVQASGYDINDPSMMPKFYKGLPFKLREAIVSHEVGPFTVEEWIEAAHKHQQKHLFLKAERGLTNLKNRPRQMGQPTQTQWRNAFSKPNKCYATAARSAQLELRFVDVDLLRATLGKLL